MNKDLKDIKFEDLKESPAFILGCYVFVALVVIGLIAFSIYSIIGIKADLVTTRQSYQTHLQEIATLEELRAQSQKAEEQLSAYKEVLPDSLGDIYLHAEGTEQLCKNFGLKIVSFQDPVEEAADTKETKFTMSVEGSFENIYFIRRNRKCSKNLRNFLKMIISARSGFARSRSLCFGG